MDKNKWKIIAIVFIILFTILISLVGMSYYNLGKYNKAANDCYHNFCGDSPDAIYYEDGVCECYDYDLLGRMIVVKERFD